MKRAFDKEVLKGLAWGDAPEGYEYVGTEDNGTSRWSSHHTTIFRFEGKLWASEYSKGLSETQDEQPYEYSEPEAYEVVAVSKTVVVTSYEPVKDPV